MRAVLCLACLLCACLGQVGLSQDLLGQKLLSRVVQTCFRGKARSSCRRSVGDHRVSILTPSQALQAILLSHSALGYQVKTPLALRARVPSRTSHAQRAGVPIGTASEKSTDSKHSLVTWLKMNVAGFDDLTIIEESSLTTGPVFLLAALRDFIQGETIFELRSNACLTASAVYADKEFGSELYRLSLAYGPGFDIVALATFLAIERVRGFLLDTWSSKKSGVNPKSAPRLGTVQPGLSDWSPLTSTLWEAESMRPLPIEESLEPLIEQGIKVALPLVERAARRAWSVKALYLESQSKARDPAMFSDAWIRAAIMEDGEGFSVWQLRDFMRRAFAMVLHERWARPPPYVGSATQSLPERWGWEATAPSGPAMLPPLLGVFAPTLQQNHPVQNAMLGVPPPPLLGNLGEGVCLRCAASRDISAGEVIWVAGNPSDQVMQSNLD